MRDKIADHETIMNFMAKDHDRLDEIFHKFQEAKEKDVNEAKELFSQFKIGLQRHIVWEEEILFPAFEKRADMQNGGPTFVMREEHRQIGDWLHKIHDQIKEGRTDTSEFEHNMLFILKQHNEKEENILYPWIDHSLSEEEINKMFEQMRNLPPERYQQCCSHHK